MLDFNVLVMRVVISRAEVLSQEGFCLPLCMRAVDISVHGEGW